MVSGSPLTNLTGLCSIIFVTHVGVDNPPPIPTIVYRGVVMKKIIKTAAILVLALLRRFFRFLLHSSGFGVASGG